METRVERIESISPRLTCAERVGKAAVAPACANTASGVVMRLKARLSAEMLPTGWLEASSVFTRKFICTADWPTARGAIRRTTLRTAGSEASSVSR